MPWPFESVAVADTVTLPAEATTKEEAVAVTVSVCGAATVTQADLLTVLSPPSLLAVSVTV